MTTQMSWTHDGDGNENGKKGNRLDQQNNNFERASRFFVHFFAVTRIQTIKKWLKFATMCKIFDGKKAKSKRQRGRNQSDMYPEKNLPLSPQHNLYTHYTHRVVTMILCRWVSTTSRQGIKQLGISFGSIFLLFSNKSSQGPHSQQPGEIPGPRLLMTACPPLTFLSQYTCFNTQSSINHALHSKRKLQWRLI